MTCEWISVEPVEGQKVILENEKSILDYPIIIKLLEHRANLLLHRSAMELSMRVMGEEPAHPFDAWNAVQPHCVQEVALAYGELVMIKDCIERITLLKEGKLPEH